MNNKILERALGALETAATGANVQQESLQSAMAVLKSMGSSSKSGASDPLSSAVISALREYSRELEGMSAEQRDKMIALTNAQIDAIKAMDKGLQQKYISRKMEIHDEAIVENKVYQDVVARM